MKFVQKNTNFIKTFSILKFWCSYEPMSLSKFYKSATQYALSNLEFVIFDISNLNVEAWKSEMSLTVNPKA